MYGLVFTVFSDTMKQPKTVSIVLMNHSPCILCGTMHTSFYYEDGYRTYLHCPVCRLVFVPPHQRLSPEEEKERYDLHENDPHDEDYRRFLSRLFIPLNERLKPNSLGLDFGSGPGPALHLMFKEKGHRMRIYDPFYADNPAVFEQVYDFITSTEVMEHLYNPREEVYRLWNCLKAGGYLGLMTKMVKSREAFKSWHYIRDETHVAFYSRHTFRWLADQWQAPVTFLEDDVIIFQKK